MSAEIQSYKDLVVWQKSMDLVVMVYNLSQTFPKSEIYGLVSQMRRCSVSIPSNIAEGKLRGSRKDFRHFLTISFGSGAELETQIEIAKRLKYTTKESFVDIDNVLLEVMKMLNKFIYSLSA